MCHTLHLGKLTARGFLSAVAPGQLVLIKDDLSDRRFLVDTGAAYSVFPHSSPSPPSGPALSSASGRPIACWGEKSLTLSFNGKCFTWPFLLAAVQFPILGVDFLRHFKLLVNPSGNCLVDTVSLRTFRTSTAGGGHVQSALSSPTSLPSQAAGGPEGMAVALVPPNFTLPSSIPLH